MKRIIIVLLACIALMGASAQNTSKAGSTSKAKTEQVANNGKRAVKNNGKPTGRTYKGFPVYQGAKGGYYVIRTSKKTGNEYKQYVKPEQFDK